MNTLSRLSKTALNEVYLAYSLRVATLLRRMSVREQDIPDVRQDVLLSVYRNIDGFDGRASIQTWLYRICHNAAIDYHRRHARRSLAVGQVETEPATDADTLDQSIRRETRAQLVDALRALDAQKREVLLLHDVAGLAMSDIASALDLPLQTGFWQLHAGRKQLSSRMRRAAVVTSCPKRPAPSTVVPSWRSAATLASAADASAQAQLDPAGEHDTHGRVSIHAWTELPSARELARLAREVREHSLRCGARIVLAIIYSGETGSVPVTQAAGLVDAVLARASSWLDAIAVVVKGTLGPAQVVRAFAGTRSLFLPDGVALEVFATTHQAARWIAEQQLNGSAGERKRVEIAIELAEAAIQRPELLHAAE